LGVLHNKGSVVRTGRCTCLLLALGDARSFVCLVTQSCVDGVILQ